MKKTLKINCNTAIEAATLMALLNEQGIAEGWTIARRRLIIRMPSPSSVR